MKAPSTKADSTAAVERLLECMTALLEVVVAGEDTGLAVVMVSGELERTEVGVKRGVVAGNADGLE